MLFQLSSRLLRFNVSDGFEHDKASVPRMLAISATAGRGIAAAYTGCTQRLRRPRCRRRWGDLSAPRSA